MSNIIKWLEQHEGEWIVHDANSDIGRDIAANQQDSHYVKVWPIMDRAPLSEDLEQLRKLAEAATPGPWAVNNSCAMVGGNLVADEVYVYSPAKRNVAIAADVADPETGEMSEPNADYIAAANPAVVLALLDTIASQRQVIAGDEKARNMKFVLGQCIHNMVVAEQAAWIEWKHGAGAEAAMEWIENGLIGPGHLPKHEGMSAQEYFNANVDERMDPPAAPVAPHQESAAS